MPQRASLADAWLPLSRPLAKHFLQRVPCQLVASFFGLFPVGSATKPIWTGNVLINGGPTSSGTGNSIWAHSGHFFGASAWGNCFPCHSHRVSYQFVVLFRKMALRDAIRGRRGAETFAKALFELLHGRTSLSDRFDDWIEAIARLPRRQTRVLTWPLVTVFGFLAQPQTHFFFKPTVTREAARRYGNELSYASRPSWSQYQELLNFVSAVRRDLRNLKPRDMIDLQSFLWVQGSDEYPD